MVRLPNPQALIFIPRGLTINSTIHHSTTNYRFELFNNSRPIQKVAFVSLHLPQKAGKRFIESPTTFQYHPNSKQALLYVSLLSSYSFDPIISLLQTAP